MSDLKKSFYFLTVFFVVVYFYLLLYSVAQKYSLNYQAAPTPSDADSKAVSQSICVSESSSDVHTVHNAAADDKYPQKLNVYKNSILPYNEHRDSDYIENTLFIGDSNTLGLYAYGYLPLQNVLGKKSMGIQQADTEKYAYFEGFDQGFTAIDGAKLLCPRRIIINFGTNNAAGSSVNDFIACYRAVLAKLSAACPYSDIIVAAVLPVGYYRENYAVKQSTIDSFNIALAKMCSETGYKFLDYSEVFRSSTGYMKSGCAATDGIHLTQKGYKILLEYIDSHQFVTDDRRPQRQYVPMRCEDKQSFVIQNDTVGATINKEDFLQSEEESSSSESNEENLSGSSSDLGNINSEKIIYDPFL